MTLLNRVYHLPRQRCPEPLMNGQRRSFQDFVNRGFSEEFRPYRIVTLDDPTDPDRRVAWRFFPEHLRLMTPPRTPRQCILKRYSYTIPLWIPVVTTVDNAPRAMDWFKLMDLPLMTQSGHFIINGNARVVLNQTVRSPGVHTQRVPLTRGRSLTVADFIAQRGTWLRLELNGRDGGIWAKLKYRPRMPLLPFLRCFGMPTHVINTYVDVLVNPRRREIRRYDEALITGGRRHNTRRRHTRRGSVRRRLSIISLAPRHGTHPWSAAPWLYGFRDLIEAEDSLRWYQGRVLTPRQQPWYNATMVWHTELRRRFWNPRTYTLGVAGRRRLNQNLGLRLSDTATHLSAIDVLFGALLLLRTMAGVVPYGDRDDLQSRTVKPVGVLLQTQLAVGLAQFEVALRESYAEPASPDRGLAGHSLLLRPRQSSLLPRWSYRHETHPGYHAAPMMNGQGLPLPTPYQPDEPQPVTTIPHDQPIASACDELNECFRTFFTTNPLSQFLDETNGLAELTHKRRLSSLGLGGLTRETATMAVRGIHPSHYGRICPIETPEGRNAGLVNSLTTYAALNHDGSIATPLIPTYRGYVRWDQHPHRVVPAVEVGQVIASGDVACNDYHVLSGDRVAARSGPDYGPRLTADIVSLAAHPLQMTSMATGLIPFLEHNDGNRALMGSNMQRQAVSTYGARRPIVGTGYEGRAAADVGTCAQAHMAGLVTNVDGCNVRVAGTTNPKGTPGTMIHRDHPLQPLTRSNQGTYRMQRPRVVPGSWVQHGDLLGENTGMAYGDMAVGQNLLVGYVPWEGYNFEDAILVNRRLMSEDTLTSLHISRYEVAVYDTRYGYERFTRNELPESHYHRSWEQLDDDGVVRLGAWVTAGDTLVGRVTPIAIVPETNPYARLLHAVAVRVDRSIRETSLLYPRGCGRVVHVEKLWRKPSTGIFVQWRKAQRKPGMGAAARRRKAATPLVRLRNLDDLLWFRRYAPDRLPASVKRRLLRHGWEFGRRSGSLNGGWSTARGWGKTRPARMGFDRRPNRSAKPHQARSYDWAESFRDQRSRKPKPASSSVLTTTKASSTVGHRGGHVAVTTVATRQRESTGGQSRRAVHSTLAAQLLRGNRRNHRHDTRVTPEPQWRWSSHGLGSPVMTILRRQPKPAHPELRTVGRGNDSRAIMTAHGAPASRAKACLTTAPVRTYYADRGKRYRACFSTAIVKTTVFRTTFAMNERSARYRNGWTRGLATAPVGQNLQNPCQPVRHGITLDEQRHNGLTTTSHHRRRWRKQPRSLLTNRHHSPVVHHNKRRVPRDLPRYNRVHVYVARERPIEVGDKLSGRHGNKGIISRLLPSEDMPYAPDGSSLDVVLNPLGVPSRMNVGQLFECLLGLAGASLNQNYKLEPFDEIYGREASRSLVYSKLYEARLKSGENWLFDPNFPGKVRLIDGRSGSPFEQPVTVGRAYILKLIHLVDEKIHGRTTGPYSLITQQPLRGRAKNGGQRLGEMEVWALEGFGASYTLHELITYKSDDMVGRKQLADQFQSKKPVTTLTIGVPECLRVLARELNGLGLEFTVQLPELLTPSKQLKSWSGQTDLVKLAYGQPSANADADQPIANADPDQPRFVPGQKTLQKNLFKFLEGRVRGQPSANDPDQPSANAIG